MFSRPPMCKEHVQGWTDVRQLVVMQSNDTTSKMAACCRLWHAWCSVSNPIDTFSWHSLRPVVVDKLLNHSQELQTKRQAAADRISCEHPLCACRFGRFVSYSAAQLPARKISGDLLEAQVNIIEDPLGYPGLGVKSAQPTPLPFHPTERKNKIQPVSYKAYMPIQTRHPSGFGTCFGTVATCRERRMNHVSKQSPKLTW